MRDYGELVAKLRHISECEFDDRPWETVKEAADAIEELCDGAKLYEEAHINEHDERIEEIKRHKWISVEEPPDNDRNIFICHGSTNSKAPCIGHYEPSMKLFYEDKNWFASPIYDAMFWCEMPKLPMPEPPKEE